MRTQHMHNLKLVSLAHLVHASPVQSTNSHLLLHSFKQQKRAKSNGDVQNCFIASRGPEEKKCRGDISLSCNPWHPDVLLFL